MLLSLQFLRPGELLGTDTARALKHPSYPVTLDILKGTRAKMYPT